MKVEKWDRKMKKWRRQKIEQGNKKEERVKENRI